MACLAPFDSLGRIAREYVFERIFAGVDDVEADRRGRSADFQRSGFDNGRVEVEAGGIGGYALDEHAGFAALIVLEDNGPGVGSGLGRGEGDLEGCSGAGGESGLKILRAFELGAGCRYVARIEASVGAAREFAEAAVIGFDGQRFLLADEQASEVDDARHDDVGGITGHAVADRQLCDFARPFVGRDIDVEAVGAVDEARAVGADRDFLAAVFEHGAFRGFESQSLTPVGVERACLDGPADLMAESLVDAAGEGRREFCPCLAEVVRHIGHVGHVGTGVMAQAEGITLLIALEVDNDPESLARSEE